MLEHKHYYCVVLVSSVREKKTSALMVWKNNDFALYLSSLCSVPINDIFTDNNNKWVSLAIWLSVFMFKCQIYDVQKDYVNTLLLGDPDNRYALLINECEFILLINSHSILLFLSIRYCLLPNFMIR